MTSFISIGGAASHLLKHHKDVYGEKLLFTYSALTNAMCHALIDPELTPRDFANIRLLLSAVAPGQPFHATHYHCCRTVTGPNNVMVATQLHAGFALSRGLDQVALTDVGSQELKIVRPNMPVEIVDAAAYNLLQTEAERLALLELLNPGGRHFGTAQSRLRGDKIAITVADEAECEFLAVVASPVSALGKLRGKLSYGGSSLQGVVDGVVYSAPVGVATPWVGDFCVEQCFSSNE
jgi:hypothetical protein